MFELGNSLREERSRRRIDLVEAEHDTKIRSKYLAALEGEDFDVLPGPVFARGFLRTYARYLGLDSQMYIDEYNARFGRFVDAEESVALHARPAVTRTLHAQRRRHRAASRAMRLVVLGTLVGLAVVAWLGLREQDAGRADGRPTAIASEEGNVADSSDSRGVELRASDDRPIRRPAPGAPAASASTSATSSTLKVSAQRGPSWIEVRVGGPAGRVLFTGVLQRGDSRQFEVSTLHVTAGRPASLRLALGRRIVDGRGVEARAWTIRPGVIRAA